MNTLKDLNVIKLNDKEKKVVKALIRASQPTIPEHHYICDLRRAYKALKINSSSFSGILSALKNKGIYGHIIWETNKSKTGYKDHPAKSVKTRHGNVIKVRSDVAIIIDPVFFQKGSK